VTKVPKVIDYFGMVQSWVAASKPALSEVEWAQLGDGKTPKES